MSYPSIVQLTRHAAPETLSREGQEALLLEAFDHDLPLGMAYIRDLVAEMPARLLRPEDPNSPLGKQLLRLLGTDVARGILERHFGVAFGLYNCCGVVIAPSREELAMHPLEQIQLQNGVLASADC